jgi:hypothetical protein
MSLVLVLALIWVVAIPAALAVGSWIATKRSRPHEPAIAPVAQAQRQQHRLDEVPRSGTQLRMIAGGAGSIVR